MCVLARRNIQPCPSMQLLVGCKDARDLCKQVQRVNISHAMLASSGGVILQVNVQIYVIETTG